jgi:hypothetical protein
MAKSKIEVSSRKSAALARRLAPGGNVFGGGTRSIPLKSPQEWHTYIANTYNNDDEFYRMRHEMGWEPLMADDLACLPEEIGFIKKEDGTLVRGSQGREMIFKMPIADYKALQQAKTDRNRADIGRPSKVKESVVGALAATAGDEAASFAQQHFTGTVTDTVEPLR